MVQETTNKIRWTYFEKKRMILFSWAKHNKKQRESRFEAVKRLHRFYKNNRDLPRILRAFFWDYNPRDSTRIPKKLLRHCIGILQKKVSDSGWIPWKKASDSKHVTVLETGICTALITTFFDPVNGQNNPLRLPKFGHIFLFRDYIWQALQLKIQQNVAILRPNTTSK